LPTSYFVVRVLVGLLFSDDFTELRKYAGYIYEGEPGKSRRIAFADAELELESIFMELEHSGFVQKGGRRSDPLFLWDVRSRYLRANGWLLTALGRRHALDIALKEKRITSQQWELTARPLGSSHVAPSAHDF
jgi:hypothetical protein